MAALPIDLSGLGKGFPGDITGFNAAGLKDVFRHDSGAPDCEYGPFGDSQNKRGKVFPQTGFPKQQRILYYTERVSGEETRAGFGQCAPAREPEEIR
jgi:hypothetical protein